MEYHPVGVSHGDARSNIIDVPLGDEDSDRIPHCPSERIPDGVGHSRRHGHKDSHAHPNGGTVVFPHGNSEPHNSGDVDSYFFEFDGGEESHAVTHRNGHPAPVAINVPHRYCQDAVRFGRADSNTDPSPDTVTDLQCECHRESVSYRVVSHAVTDDALTVAVRVDDGLHHNQPHR
eukprot:PhM_4_TR17364/c0_g1_i1/m.35400